MTGLPPQKQFPDWIKGLLALKAAASYTDYAAAWLRGARMLIRTGTTTVGDIEAVPELLPEVWSSTPLRVFSFLRIDRCQEPPQTVRNSAGSVRKNPIALRPNAHSRGPFASRAVFDDAGAAANRRRGWPGGAAGAWRCTWRNRRRNIEMYVNRGGPLFEWLKNQRDMSDCGDGTPVEQVRRCGLLGENFLAVHANYLEPADIAALAESRSHVVHCPRSHAYFQHAPFPYRGIGRRRRQRLPWHRQPGEHPSSRGAEKPELNMFAEMRQFAGSHPDVAPEQIVRMATQAGARALGLQDRVGGIFPGATADLTAIPFAGEIADAWEAVVQHCRGRFGDDD